MGRVVEFRSYVIKAGKRDEFHRLVSNESYPLMSKWNIDVVAFGPSLHDGQSYILVRSYADNEERIASQNRFYGSAAWRDGPRNSIIELIESDVNIVVEMDADAIQAIRESRIGAFH